MMLHGINGFIFFSKMVKHEPLDPKRCKSFKIQHDEHVTSEVITVVISLFAHLWSQFLSIYGYHTAKTAFSSQKNVWYP